MGFSILVRQPFGLVPNRQQAIIWTNESLFYWCAYGSPGLTSLWNSTMFAWREHHHFCRTTLSIMPLGWLSAIQCNWPRWSNWDRTDDLITTCVCSATIMLNIKHTGISCIHMRWVGTTLSPASYILLLCRKLIFIYIIVISGKIYLKSILRWCL